MNIDVLPLLSFVMVTTFTPGPNNISSASMGMSKGYRKTLHYLIGIISGFFIVMVVCAFLASTLLNILPVLGKYLRYVGALYILWLAVGILRSRHSISDSRDSAGIFIKGFLLQLINPKVAVYGLTLYSTFLAAISHQTHYLLLSAVILALIGFTAISTWALFGAAIGEKLKNDLFRRVLNIVLFLLLVYTALDLSGILSLLGVG